MKRALAAALACLAAFAAPGCVQRKPAPPVAVGWRAIHVRAVPAAPTKAGEGAVFGDLIFRGGLRLTSTDRKFGGWSSLKFSRTGALIALSDEGAWLSMRLVLDPKTGALTGVVNARMAPLTDWDGAPLHGKIDADSEGLARLADGRFAVSFEHIHRIWIYDLDRAGPTAPPEPGPPPQVTDLKPNEGLEAVVGAPNGELLAGSETPPPGEKSPRFYLYKLGAPAAQALLEEGPAETSAGNALVDMDRLPDGDVVALERFYVPLIGNRTALRRYAIAGLAAKPPALSGPLLASFATPQNIDNFEGVAVTTAPDGATRLYIISDNNFSPAQQTLLYAFDLARPTPKPLPLASSSDRAESSRRGLKAALPTP